MRLLFTNLLATMLLLLGASVASAVSFSITSNYDGVSVLVPSDTVTVSVYLDANVLDIQIADVGIQFDGGILAFQESSSSMSSYLLYSAASGKTIPARWLQPLPNHINGGSVDFYGGLDATPKLFLGSIPNLVTVGYATPDFGGTRVTDGGPDKLLATVVFHVIGAGDGLGEINVVMTTANVVQLATGPTNITNSVGLSGSFAVITPEPGTAIMVGLGLAGLAVAGKRRRA